MGKRVVKRYTPSHKAEAIEHARQHGVSGAAKKLGMIRLAIYGWLRKAEAAAAGDGESPTTGPAPSEIEAQALRAALHQPGQYILADPAG